MNADDLTLPELRQALAEPIAANAAFDGWNDRALDMAASSIGVPLARAKLAFPDGPRGMIDAWFAAIDHKMAEACPADSLADSKIRDRLRDLILSRLAIVRPNREALRRALAILALPTNLAFASRLCWRGADAMWRLAGDDATDFNHYTKRTTLAAIYTATVLVWINDESEGEVDTRDFLDRRINDVMRFERAKAKLKPDMDRHFSPARFLGRLRYPVT